MEHASEALVARKYFEAEQLAAEALRRAYGLNDYDRIARIALPLQEARRQKRDLAFDAAQQGAVFLINGDMPDPETLAPGCYLVAPPRVGVDGRTLREAADHRRVPVIVVVREPTSREGLWPIVAVGPLTVRTKVPPPEPPAPAPSRSRKTSKKPGPPTPAAPEPLAAPPSIPDPQWFLTANEMLGDAAIALAESKPNIFAQVEVLVEYLTSHPDHEKLHQRLEEAARAAAREPATARRPPPGYDPEADDDHLDDEAEDAA